MEQKLDRSCTAFADSKKIASGNLVKVAVKVKEFMRKESKAAILIFDDVTSAQVEIDFRGTAEAVSRRLEALLQPEEKKVGPGRPKLGVTSKEVTLLPQHWEWLALQPGGASVTLRKLIEEAKKKNVGRDQLRQAQEATYKFMTVMAGDLPNFEEALRALYANDSKKFEKMISAWPKDVQEHTLKLAEGSWKNQ